MKSKDLKFTLVAKRTRAIKALKNTAKNLTQNGDISKESLDGLIFLIEEYLNDSYNYKEECEYEY